MSEGFVRRVRVLRWLASGGMLVAMVVAAIAIGSPPAARAAGPNRAGLVVRYGDGSVYTTCVEFSEPEISGVDLLQRAGLNVIIEQAGPYGGAVCKIELQGCDYPLDDCFCKCVGPDCTYWAYYHLKPGGWEYSTVGAGGYKVHNGDVEGWSWGPGDYGVSGTQPPLVQPDQVCAVQQPTATDTALPTATSKPTNTNTPTPVPTRTPTRTETPTAPPATIEFWIERAEVVAGQCTNLGWRISNAVAVYLNGQGVTGEETRPVCPAADTTYALRVVSAGGETTRELTLRVVAATPTPTAPLSPTSPAAGTRPATAAWTRTPSPSSTFFTLAATATPTSLAPATATPAATATPEAVAELDVAAPEEAAPTESAAEAHAATPAPTPRVWSLAGGAKPKPQPPTPDAAGSGGGAPAATVQGSPGRIFDYGLFFLMAALLAGLGIWVARRQLA